MKQIAIIDIDSTIANNSHRSHHLETVCKNSCKTRMRFENSNGRICASCSGTEFHIPQSAWDAFLQPELLIQDSVVPYSLEVVENLRERGIKIYYLTGRNEKHRPVTEQWLRENFSWNEFTEKLLMRDLSGAGVPASVMKEKIFLEQVYYKHFAAFYSFYDDDDHVLSMYSKYGLTFKAPDVWKTMYVEHPKEAELPWRK